MPHVYAQQNGNWNATGMWNTAANGSGSSATPASGDTVDLNGFAIVLNVPFTLGVGSIIGGVLLGATPSDSDKCTGVSIVYDVDNQPVVGVDFQFLLVATDASPGHSYPLDYKLVTSGTSGALQITNLLQNATYRARRRKDADHWGPWCDDFPTGSGASFILPEILGRPG